MNKLMLFFTVFSLTASANDFSSNFDSSNKLMDLWHREDIYFVSQVKSEIPSWNGMIYHYATKKCK